MQLLGILRIGPCLRAHPFDRFRIEAAKLGSALRILPAPGHDGLGPPFLQRRVVEVGVGPRRQRLQRERRGLRQIAGNNADIAGFEPRQKPLEPFDIHRLVQAVEDRLVGQGMVGDLALAGEIFGAGDLVGEDRRDQILGLHA